jgi:hypothetical protein
MKHGFSDRAHDQTSKPKISPLRRLLIAAGGDLARVLAPPRRGFRDALPRHEVSWAGAEALP